MDRALDWASDGRDWPDRDASRFLQAGGVEWRVQSAGDGDAIVLLHGTGASAHTWRGVFAALAEDFRVIAPDLPGQGFSVARSATSLSMEGMAKAVGELLTALSVRPRWLVGHSAGAAVAARMVLDGQASPAGLVAIAPALTPFGGAVAPAFAPLARMLARSRLLPLAFSRLASDAGSVRRLVERTGSSIDERGLALYRTLIRSDVHVANTLEMMGRWRLDSLAADLPRLRVPLYLLYGTRDLATPPRTMESLVRLLQLPPDRVRRFEGLGHLLHEERPAHVVELIREIVRRCAPTPSKDSP